MLESIKGNLAILLIAAAAMSETAFADRKLTVKTEKVKIQSVLCDSGHYLGWDRVVTQEELSKTACDAPESIRGLEILVRKMGEKKLQKVKTDRSGNFTVNLAPGRYDIVASSLDAKFCANGSYFHPLLPDKIPNGCRTYSISSFGNIQTDKISEFWSNLAGKKYEFVTGMTITVRKNASNTFRLKFYQPVSNIT